MISDIDRSCESKERQLWYSLIIFAAAHLSSLVLTRSVPFLYPGFPAGLTPFRGLVSAFRAEKPGAYSTPGTPSGRGDDTTSRKESTLFDDIRPSVVRDV
jgi:hypothetical protein